MKRLYLLFFLGAMMMGPDTRAADPRADKKNVTLLTFGVAALYLGLRLRPGA